MALLLILLSFSYTGDPIVKVVAVDKDDPHTSNGMVTYRILSQKPSESGIDLFDINPLNGMLSVKALGLDREVSILCRFPPLFRYQFITADH